MKYSERLISRELRKWSDITADPLWYRQIGPERTSFAEPRRPKTLPRIASAGILAASGVELKYREPAKQSPKHVLYLVFEELLATNQVALAARGEGIDWDSERRPVDKIIIHHSRNSRKTRSDYHSAMELLRIYAPVYNHPEGDDQARIAERPLMHSGHFNELHDRQVFWIYHWFVRPDGLATRYLSDHQTGWQAGDWAVNCSSVAICIDDDLSVKSPSRAVLDATAHVIEQNYDHLNIGPETVLGHNEVRSDLDCPGDKFLPRWKGLLLERLGA